MVKTAFEPDVGSPEDTRDLRFVPADPKAAKTLSAEQVEQFNRDGYVSGLPAFEGDRVAEIRAYIDELLDAVLGAPDRRNSYSINAYHMVCAGLYDLILEPVLLDYVQDIVGPDIGCWGDHLFAKMPGDGKAVPFHQDAIYWPLTPTRSVTVWLAIDDADAENAAMQFVPGSHRRGAIPHEDVGLDGTRVLRRQAVDVPSYGEPFVNELRAGQVSLHSDLLLHGSAPNTSNRRRAGLTLRYAAGEVCAVPGYESWLKPGVRCRGTLPDHWGTWRRPDGEHPEKMSAFSGDFDGNVPDAG